MKEVSNKPRFDRSIVEGPLRPAVWKIAWPTMLTNVMGGLQGMVDHALVGNLVGFGQQMLINRMMKNSEDDEEQPPTEKDEAGSRSKKKLSNARLTQA